MRDLGEVPAAPVRALLAFAWMMMAPGCDPADGNDDAAADSGAGGKADDAGELECQLSDLGLDVFDAIYFGDFEWSTVPAPRTLTYANEAGAALVDGPQIFPELGRLIEAAEHDVNLAMFVFNPGTDPSREVFDGIARLESRLADEGRHGNPVIVRIVINANNVLGGDGAAIPNIRAIEALDLDPELVDVEVATRGSWFRGAMHQKLVVIDGDVVHIGGANVQDEHDWTTPEQTPWRDSAYVLRGEIAQSLLFDFERMWSEAQEWTCPNDDDDDCRSDDTLPFERVVPELGEGCVPMMALTRRARGWFNNDTDHPHARGFLAAMDGAKKLLRIQTPNLNDDAAKDAILRAVARGVRVELILPISFNDTFESLPDQGGTNAENVDEIYARALHETNAEHACEYLHVHWFGQDEVGIVDGNVEGQSHVKYLSVDHQMVILGSTNMDTQSWNYSGEANVIIDDPDVTDRYDAAVFERSLATSPAAGHCAGFR